MLIALGAKTDPLTGVIPTPSEATLLRALANVDATDLQRRGTEWVTALRASTGQSARLPAATHDGAIVIAQRQIPDKGSEITQLAALVAELDLAGTVVTVDALCRHRHKASYAEYRIMPGAVVKVLVSCGWGGRVFGIIRARVP
ncbi:MAG: hypothetical protein ACRDRS_14455, partial [Pseudonocardiaceae bacterium]